MTDEKPTVEAPETVGPVAYIVLGVILLVLGWSFVSDGTQPLGAIGLIADAGLVLFGIIAQVVKTGVQSSRDDRQA
jgi:hypothetical protein